MTGATRVSHPVIKRVDFLFGAVNQLTRTASCCPHLFRPDLLPLTIPFPLIHSHALPHPLVISSSFIPMRPLYAFLFRPHFITQINLVFFLPHSEFFYLHLAFCVTLTHTHWVYT